MAKSPDKIMRSGATGKFVGKSPRVLGTTKDGVDILKPRGRATHFTVKELRAAITSVREAKRAG